MGCRKLTLHQRARVDSRAPGDYEGQAQGALEVDDQAPARASVEREVIRERTRLAGTAPPQAPTAAAPSLTVPGVGTVTWFCGSGTSGRQACGGQIDPSDLYRGRWSCDRTASGGWECSGDLDESTLLTERWSCDRTASGDWGCSGDVDRSTLVTERWSCDQTASGGWECSGDIDRSSLVTERWACSPAASLAWECSGDLGRLFPIVMPIVLSAR